MSNTLDIENADVKVENAEVLNRQLLDAISEAPEGYLKKASDAASNMIRRKLRENGFSRLVIPYKQVSNEDLSYLPDTELPVVVEEMEPDSPGAKSITFNDSADTAFYRADKFVVRVTLCGSTLADNAPGQAQFLSIRRYIKMNGNSSRISAKWQD